MALWGTKMSYRPYRIGIMLTKVTRVNFFISLTFEAALDRLPTSLCHQECRWNISDRRCICRKEDQFPLVDHYYIGAVCAFLLCKFDVRRPIYSKCVSKFRRIEFPSISASVFFFIYIQSIFFVITHACNGQLFRIRFQFRKTVERHRLGFFRLQFFPSIKYFAVESKRSKVAGNTRSKRQTRICVCVRNPWAKTYKEENSANVKKISIYTSFSKS